MEENKSKIVRIFEDRYNKTVTVGNLKSDEINILIENVATLALEYGVRFRIFFLINGVIFLFII